MRTMPARLDVLPARTGAVMSLLAALVVLLAVGYPLMWGVAQVVVHRGYAVGSVDDSSTTTALLGPPRPLNNRGDGNHDQAG